MARKRQKTRIGKTERMILNNIYFWNALSPTEFRRITKLKSTPYGSLKTLEKKDLIKKYGNAYSLTSSGYQYFLGMKIQVR
nr:MAG: hypothetical protein [uncultured archaeon]